MQGHHWDNSQATIHPFVIYYEENEELKCYNLALISDSLKHDTTAVHCFISVVIPELKKIITNLNTVKYFSDGAASQYKNYKNLVNLCLMSRTSMSMQNGIFLPPATGRVHVMGLVGQ